MIGAGSGKNKVYPDGVRGTREDWKWYCELGGRGWSAGQAVTNSSAERFRLGERLERLSISMPTTWSASL